MQRTDRNHNDRLFNVEHSRELSDTERAPINCHCIALNDDASKQPHNGPHDVATSTPQGWLGQVRGSSLERSRSDRADYRMTLPRWDGVNVWVPNVAGHGGRCRPVERSKTNTEPRQSLTLPTTSTTRSWRRSRGAKLLSAAGSKLAKVWNQRPTKLQWKFSTYGDISANDETSTAQQPVLEDLKSVTLTVCRKCHGKTFSSASFNHSVAAASAIQTANMRTVTTAPEVTLPTVSRDLDTESGYLISRAMSNSPNDVVSCRTLPSTTRDDASGEDNKDYTKDSKPQENRHVPLSFGPSAECDVVEVKGSQHQQDLLSWKMSLMDRADGRLTAPASWVRDSNSSSDDDGDDDRKARSSSYDAGSRVESSRNAFSFENDFERALETPKSPTTAAMPGNDDSCAAPADDVDKMFDDKLDELLSTTCDVKTDRMTCLREKDNGKKPPKQQFQSSRSINTDRRLESDDKTTTDRMHLAIPSIVITGPLQENTNSSSVECRRCSSLPSRTSMSTRVRTTAAVVHKSFDPADVDDPTFRRPSSVVSASVLDRDNGENINNWQGKVDSVGGQIRSKFVPTGTERSLPRDSEASQTEHQWIAEQPQEPSIRTQSLTTSSRRQHCDVTFSSAIGDRYNFDNDRRILPWRKLRNAVDDAVVELTDDLLQLLQRVDGRTTTDLAQADVDRLRRRLLRNVRTALWTDSELAAGSADAKDQRDDELQRLRRFVEVLLDCSGEDDVCGITDIKKYVMTQHTGYTEDAVLSQHRQSCSNDRKINVFVLRHGVSIDGLHVSVAGRSDLPVRVTQDTSECMILCVYTVSEKNAQTLKRYSSKL